MVDKWSLSMYGGAMNSQQSPTLRRRLYRSCAPVVLKVEGYEVETDLRAGGIPPMRLMAKIEGRAVSMVIRTSLTRKLKGNRDAHGKWRTIPNCDEVLAIVPAYGDPGSIEALRFDSEKVIGALDADLKALEERGSRIPLEQPVVLPLDGKRLSRSETVTPGLKRIAKWSKEFTLSALLQTAPNSPQNQSIERMKREFAALNGVDESQVVVDIGFRVLR